MPSEIMKNICRQYSESPPWYVRTAIDLSAVGNCFHIFDRTGTEPYLSRFWLSEPRPANNVVGIGSPYCFENSVFLHYFHRDDNDQAMHDHPAPFTSHILAGGYDEILPTIEYNTAMPFNGKQIRGPEIYPDLSMRRRPGDFIEHEATDLHMAINVLPGTWTLVTTGNKLRSWGFHPPGKTWVGWREYLRIHE